MRSLVCWLCVLFSMHVRVGWAVQVTVDPSSFNASQGENVTFNCTYLTTEVQGAFFQHVLSNGSSFSLSAESDIHDGMRVTIKRAFLANGDNNCSNVTCVASANDGTTHYSEPAVLKVQGLLPAPSNVSVNDMNTTAIWLSWEAPPTLDITDVDPDISNYTVYITNTSCYTGIINQTTVLGTEYIFTRPPGEEDPDPWYKFCVSAWNVVGEGERSEPVDGTFITQSSGLSGFTLTLTVTIATIIIGVVCTCYYLW